MHIYSDGTVDENLTIGSDYEGEPQEDEIGCCFPGECCMPGEHFKHECHTAAMIEQWNKEGAKAEAELFDSLGREGGERNG